MARLVSTPRPLSRLRLCCIAFIVTFIGVTANLWMLHWLPRLFEQRNEVTEPSGGGPSRLPLLASLGDGFSLKPVTPQRAARPQTSRTHTQAHLPQS